MTRKFNLQPWREERRQAQKKQFMAVTLIIVALAVIAFLAERWYQQRIVKQQQDGIALLEQDISRFDHAKSEVERLNALNEEVNRQISVIQDLQDQRGVAVEILDYIASNTPDSVFLSSIDFQNMNLTINGTAENDKGVSEFMRIMSDFDYVRTPDVALIQSAENNNLFSVSTDSEVKSFEVNMQIDSQKEEKP